MQDSSILHQTTCKPHNLTTTRNTSSSFCFFFHYIIMFGRTRSMANNRMHCTDERTVSSKLEQCQKRNDEFICGFDGGLAIDRPSHHIWLNRSILHLLRASHACCWLPSLQIIWNISWASYNVHVVSSFTFSISLSFDAKALIGMHPHAIFVMWNWTQTILNNIWIFC